MVIKYLNSADHSLSSNVLDKGMTTSATVVTANRPNPSSSCLLLQIGYDWNVASPNSVIHTHHCFYTMAVKKDTGDTNRISLKNSLSQETVPTSVMKNA